MMCNVFRRVAIKTGSGEDYYKYLCVYVDDQLVTSHRAHAITRQSKKVYRFKDKPKPLNVYLGTSIKLNADVDDNKYW